MDHVQYFFFEIITCDLSIYIMDHSYFFVCSFMENSIGPKWVNLFGNVYIAWPRGYKTFSMLNSAEHEFYPAHKC